MAHGVDDHVVSNMRPTQVALHVYLNADSFILNL